MIQELPQNDASIGGEVFEAQSTPGTLAQEKVSAQVNQDSIDKRQPLTIDVADLRDPVKSAQLVDVIHSERVQNQNEEVIALYDEVSQENAVEVAKINAEIEAERIARIEKYGPEENWPEEALKADKSNQIGWGFAAVAGIGALAGMTTAEDALANDRGHDRYNDQMKYERHRVQNDARAALTNIGIGVIGNVVSQAMGQRVNPGGPVPIPGAQYGYAPHPQAYPVYQEHIPQGGYVQQGGYQGYDNGERIRLEQQANSINARIQNARLEEGKKYNDAMQTYRNLQANPGNQPVRELYNRQRQDYEQAVSHKNRMIEQLREIQSRMGR